MPFKEKDSYNEYMRGYMLRRYHERMNYARKALGDYCRGCGLTSDEVDLELHHVDPSEKSFTIGKLWSVSLSRFLEELDKCNLMCGDCHKDTHY